MFSLQSRDLETLSIWKVCRRFQYVTPEGALSSHKVIGRHLMIGGTPTGPEEHS